MRATEMLKQEHRLIEQVLDCVERIAAGAADFDRDAATSAVEFLVDFADRRHHGKEEDLLFVAMSERGIPAQVGPIGVMLSEHTTGRAAIAAMRSALDSDDPKAGQHFAGSAMEYVTLLRQHIQKEDHILYPMADSVFDQAVEERLAKDYAALEAQPGEDAALARNLEIAERLAAKFDVARAADRKPTTFSGCVHQHGADADSPCH